MSLPPLDPRRERGSLFLLTAAQFTHIVDFMILMPLGPQLMRSFAIDAGHFGWLVSAYTFSAGAAGLVATVFLDRFDRKRSFLLLYAGFALATLSCAFAPNFYLLLAARVVAGAFGGVTNAQVLAIVSDLIPLERRGRALGVVMSGFSLASIFGVPAGLVLARGGDWHTPFIVLAALSALVLAALAHLLPRLPAHPLPGGWHATVAQLREVATTGNHVRAFALTVTLSLAGFMVFPYISPSLVANSGFPEDLLWLVYVAGGIVTIFVTNYSGRLADRLGRLRVFQVAALASLGPLLLVTHLPPVPVWGAVAAVTLFMCLNSARFVPAMAMMSGSVVPRMRSGFMNLNSALQQIAGGLSVSLAALVVSQDEAKHILHYGTLGWISAGFVLLALWLARFVRVAEVAMPPPAPVRRG